MVIPPLIGNPYNGYINPYYLFPLPKSLNKVYQTCHSDMPNSNQLFFSTSPPFTTGWVMLGDPKRSRCIWFFHFPIVLAIVVCQLSWFVICSYRIFFPVLFSSTMVNEVGRFRTQFVEFSVRHILCVAAPTWDPFKPESLILTAPACFFCRVFCMLNDALPFQLYMPTRL